MYQSSSVAQLYPTLCDPMNRSTPGPPSITNSRSLLKLMPIELVMPSSHLILCCPLLLLPSVPPSIRVFSSESTLSMRWPKYWSFSFSISPSNEHSGLISFRMDWLDLLAVQGTLKSLLQHQTSKASIFHVYSKPIQFYVCVCVCVFQINYHYRVYQNTEYSSLCYQINPCLPILYIVVCIC